MTVSYELTGVLTRLTLYQTMECYRDNVLTETPRTQQTSTLSLLE
jgi:hypothetical protein